MSRFYFVITSLLISASTLAAPRPKLTTFQGCGEYRIQGVIILENLNFVLKVLPGTQSAVTFKLGKEWFDDIINYKNREIFITGQILSELDTYEGTLELPTKPQPTEETVINYADLSHGYAYQLITPLPCRKSK